MWPFGPSARYRLYTTIKSYTSFFSDWFSGNIYKGDDVQKFERQLETFFATRHAVCVPMARMGIHYAVKYLIKPGQEVILSPYTIADVINTVIAAGAVPVFADIDRASCNIEASNIEKLISPKTGAVMITHLHGVTADVNRIKALCDKHNLPLIEDAAQCFGASVGFGASTSGKRVGTFGAAGIVSLGMYKNINSFFGGVLFTDDEKLASQVRHELNAYPLQTGAFIFKKLKKGLLSDVITLGPIFRSFTFWIFRFGFLNDIEAINKRVRTELDVSRRDSLLPHYRSRLTPYQARLCASQMDTIDSNNKLRNQKGGRYWKALSNIPGLIVPLHNESNIYTYFPIQYQDRTELLKWLMANGRDVAAQHLRNVCDLPGFNEFPGGNSCPNARATAEQVILLPCYPRYSDAEIDKTIAVLRSFFEKSRVKESARQATPEQPTVASSPAQH